LAQREEIISLMHPHNTEMDLSIASALYFACRGQGFVYDEEGTKIKQYTTPTRVLLSGLGADELFAGYFRHAVAFSRHGFSVLIDELALDFNRLGKRNLGRDDRVTAHWGREIRYPFLDEDVVAWAVEAPVWEKCGFGADIGGSTLHDDPQLEPGKLILRLLAWNCGLKKIATEKKRAVRSPNSKEWHDTDGRRYNSVHELRRCTPARLEERTR
jgi:asparagine synthetase B (glutamine-hydrolysing)